MIPFNKPYLTGKETHYIYDAVNTHGQISGNGYYTKKCHQFLKNRYKLKTALLTTSCTDALEMTALLMDIKTGDEIIVPSYTFVSTALAYVRQGAKIVFADSRKDHPGMDEHSIEQLITAKTKAIVVVHYAGVASDMDKILEIAKKHDLFVVEDAAQAIESSYKGKQLGTIGDFGVFSFHETKNIQCGEGGLIMVNNENFSKRAEILWEKGTNRAEFFRGEVNKYGWVDTGSSFLPSELNAAFLYAQLENIEAIQTRRKTIWDAYDKALRPLSKQYGFTCPAIPDFASNNAHMYYIVCRTEEERTALIHYLKANDIHAVFHYLSLHDSEYIRNTQGNNQINLPQSEKFEHNLLRLPFFFELNTAKQNKVIEYISNFYMQNI
jgi:dTDP-4-amino-4,6-dideoxygalactose transaminase